MFKPLPRKGCIERHGTGRNLQLLPNIYEGDYLSLVKPASHYPVANALTEAQILELHSLFQQEWWSVGRSLEDVRTMLQHSTLVFAISDPDTHRLNAFARVLSDRVFKALVLDVIVHPMHRAASLGSALMAHMMGHPALSKVRHFELYCLPERAMFYQRLGFTSELGDLLFMRRTQESPPGYSG